jgi:imidazolonepropionase-like amidohydrolase
MHRTQAPAIMNGTSTTHPGRSIVIRNGRVIDPVNAIDAIQDVVVTGVRIAEAGHATSDGEVVDAAGSWVIPGLVDLHVHLGGEHSARSGHRMLALAGVTTAMDLGGPIDAVLDGASRNGAGLTIAALDRLGRGERRGQSPDDATILRAFRETRARGGIGLKLHADTPVSPEALDAAIGIAETTGSWIAIHCGTTASASDLTGLREAVAVAAGRPAHIAHVNSYCRGDTADAATEAEEALALLRSAPALLAESYLSPWNGNWGGCRDGVPEIARVGTWLSRAGHPPTETGLEAAIRSGAAAAIVASRHGASYVSGDAGVEAWRDAGTMIEIGFPINPFESRVRLATARDERGFTVAAIATDGGGISRNVTAEAGLALIALGGLTPAEFVLKASTAGAVALGLAAKGHLGHGADGDVTIIDAAHSRVAMTIANGEVVMRDGRVTGRGSRVLTPPEGVAAVERTGCRVITYDPGTSGLRNGRHRVTAA